MAKATQTQKTLEREYIIPLRKEWSKVPRYKRAAKSVRAVKKFIARHMRVSDRDADRVKLDIYLNNELWFRGARKAYNKIKVKAKKEGDIVRVELVELPENIKFLKAKHERMHKKVVKKEEEKQVEEKEKLEEKVEEEKKAEEKEKVRSVEEAQLKVAEQAAKVQKHLTKAKEPIGHRKALKK